MAADISLTSGALSARVAARGAELQSLCHEGAELLWQGDPAYWSGRAPLLFPIVGRAPGDQIAVDGHHAPMKQHGFARRADWILARRCESACTHILSDSAETRAVYPRAFRLSQTHALAGATLSVTVEVANTGDAPLPFGLGFHPAFAWPLPGATGPAEIQLDNGAEPALARLDGDGLLAPEALPSPFRAGRLTLAPDLFEADAMIFPAGAGAGLSYSAPGAPRLAFTFDNCPALGIWSKPGGAPFVCVEPWHGMAARQGAGPEIAERPLSQTLAPGESARFGWSVTVG